MAEPQTRDDYLRRQKGWGLSPLASPADKRAAFESGESPLSDVDSRRPAGSGVSTMAGRDEKDAYLAHEVQQGLRPAYDLPEAYGGRPQGSSRRSLRMAREWDREQERNQKQDYYDALMQKNAQDQSIAQMRYNLSLQKRQSEESDRLLRLGIDARTQSEETEYMKSLTGLDPTSEDYMMRLHELSLTLPLGAATPASVKATQSGIAVTDIYDAARKERDKTQVAEDSKWYTTADENAKKYRDLNNDRTTYKQRLEAAEKAGDKDAIRLNQTGMRETELAMDSINRTTSDLVPSKFTLETDKYTKNGEIAEFISNIPEKFTYKHDGALYTKGVSAPKIKIKDKNGKIAYLQVDGSWGNDAPFFGTWVNQDILGNDNNWYPRSNRTPPRIVHMGDPPKYEGEPSSQQESIFRERSKVTPFSSPRRRAAAAEAAEAAAAAAATP